MNDRTLIIFTNRVQSTRISDMIFVMHRGEIVEQGLFDDLIGMNGYFKELYEIIIHVYNNLNKDQYLLSRKCLKIIYEKIKGIIIKYNGF